MKKLTVLIGLSLLLYGTAVQAQVSEEELQALRDQIQRMLDLQLEISEGIETVEIPVSGAQCLETFEQERPQGIITTRRIPVADDEHRFLRHQSTWQIAPSM